MVYKKECLYADPDNPDFDAQYCFFNCNGYQQCEIYQEATELSDYRAEHAEALDYWYKEMGIGA